MGKYIFAVLTVFAVEFALYLFGGQNISQTSLFGILFNPSGIGSNALYIAITLAVTTFGVASIIPGNIYQNYISLFYVGIVAIFITFALSLSHFYVFIYGELQPLLTDDFARAITILITAPLLAFYIMSSLEWIRGNQ